jgi:hypothetical protein
MSVSGFYADYIDSNTFEQGFNADYIGTYTFKRGLTRFEQDSKNNSQGKETRMLHICS